jgi:hypothetical protein
MLITLFVASAVLCSPAQEIKEKKYSKKDLPAVVLNSFQKEYPKASIKEVSMETEKGVEYWEIESVDGKVKRDLLYTADGKKAEAEETIEMSQVPAVVKSTLAGEYPKGKVDKAEKVMKGSSVTYEFHLKDGGKSHEVVIDTNGKVLKGGKNAKSDDEDEEEEEEDEDAQG